MSYIHQALLRDRSLILSVDDSLRDAVSEWMPSLPQESAEDHPEGPSIRVDRGLHDPFDEPALPSLALGRVKAYVDSARGFAMLWSAQRDVHGVVDLRSRIARVIVPDDANPAQADLTSVLTISAALLLLRDGRSAMHAAAVVHPGTGRAWLLCGDSHSGKSTTTANLIKAGWSYLSDDYVVVSRSGDSIEIEGWPDDFHLDEGWARGELTGVRGTFREDDLPAGKRLPLAQLGGVLFTSVSREEPTVVSEIPPIIALERLIRQSPWLVADSESAAGVFDLLKDAASLDCGELRAGLDTFSNPHLLGTIVREFSDRARAMPGRE
jgi:hypothetical protein